MLIQLSQQEPTVTSNWLRNSLSLFCKKPEPGRALPEGRALPKLVRLRLLAAAYGRIEAGNRLPSSAVFVRVADAHGPSGTGRYDLIVPGPPGGDDVPLTPQLSCEERRNVGGHRIERALRALEDPTVGLLVPPRRYQVLRVHLVRVDLLNPEPNPGDLRRVVTVDHLDEHGLALGDNVPPRADRAVRADRVPLEGTRRHRRRSRWRRRRRNERRRRGRRIDRPPRRVRRRRLDRDHASGDACRNQRRRRRGAAADHERPVAAVSPGLLRGVPVQAATDDAAVVDDDRRVRRRHRRRTRRARRRAPEAPERRGNFATPTTCASGSASTTCASGSASTTCASGSALSACTATSTAATTARRGNNDVVDVALGVGRRLAVGVLVRVTDRPTFLEVHDLAGGYLDELRALGVAYGDRLAAEGGAGQCLTGLQTDPNGRCPSIRLAQRTDCDLRLVRDRGIATAADDQVGEGLLDLRKGRVGADVLLLRVATAGLHVVSPRIALVADRRLEPRHLIDGALDVRGVLRRVDRLADDCHLLRSGHGLGGLGVAEPERLADGHLRSRLPGIRSAESGATREDHGAHRQDGDEQELDELRVHVLFLLSSFA